MVYYCGIEMVYYCGGIEMVYYCGGIEMVYYCGSIEMVYYCGIEMVYYTVYTILWWYRVRHGLVTGAALLWRHQGSGW